MATLVVIVISYSTSFVLVLRVVLVAKLLILGILSSMLLILTLYTSYLKTSLFTAWLSLLKSTGTGTNLSASSFIYLIFKLFKLIGTFFNLSICNLSTSDFKLVKLTFLRNFDTSTPVAFIKPAFIA